MTTSAISTAALPGQLDRTGEPDVPLPRSVANPRRTTWPRNASDDADRAPAG